MSGKDLFAAASDGRVEDIATLVAAGANVNYAVDYLGRTALFAAVRGGHVKAMAALLKAGAEPNHHDYIGQTALFLAVRGRNVEAIAALIKARTDIDHADSDGETALFDAAREREVEPMVALVNAGANINQPNLLGETALFYAAIVGRVEAIDVLLNAGAYPDHAGDDGETALFQAAIEGNVEAIITLVNAGANVNHARNDGHTALSLHGARYNRVKETLIRLGATFGYMKTPNREDFVNAGDTDKANMLQSSISLKDYIVQTVYFQTNLKRVPYNISLNTFSDDLKMGMFFRYGKDTVVSISFVGGSPVVRHLEARAPICAGDGRVIYTKKTTTGESHVYENSIDLAPETEIELCHPISSSYEKNWGCFGRTGQAGDSYFIVYSVIPLRIFQVSNRRDCVELPAVQKSYAYKPARDKMVVKKEYPNFQAIEKMFVDDRDLRGTSIFRGGTRGIEFERGEYLFVGHVTLKQKKGQCFPSWYVQRNVTETFSRYARMYFMYFFTVRFANGMFKLSRMSSCFQPPSPQTFHKIIFPCGIARRGSDIVVSFGRDDSDCLITSYSEASVSTMLAPVEFWDENNYVFHPNYASSLRRAGSSSRPTPERTVMRTIMPNGRVGLIGNSTESGGRFNPAITNIGSKKNKFITAWRKLNGSVETWKGYNQVAMETCSLKIKEDRLVYTRESKIVEFQAGTTTVGGEDPRLLTENECSLLMVNDLDTDGNRRMYVHNLDTNDSAMTIHPFCHNISGEMEKNWGPFYVDGELFFVYSVNPLIVSKVDGGKFLCPGQTPGNIQCTNVTESRMASNLTQIFNANGLMMRGGTPGLLFAKNEYLFVGHAVQHDRNCFADFTVQRSVNASDEPHHKKYPKFYTAFFYTIGRGGNGNWALKRLSCCSHLPGKRENFTKIHFPSGLARADLGGEFEDAFIVSFGEKDQYGGFCAVNRKFLNYVLRPVSEWDVKNYVVDVNYFVNIANIDPEV